MSLGLARNAHRFLFASSPEMKNHFSRTSDKEARPPTSENRSFGGRLNEACSSWCIETETELSPAMAPWMSRHEPVVYLLINFGPYPRKPDNPKRKVRKVFVLRARISPPTNCFPNKHKKHDTSQWRRKENKGVNKQKRYLSPSTSPARPTVLLPPMHWTDDSREGNAISPASVIATTIQEPAQRFTSPTSPSAPSPGEVFLNSEDQADMRFIVGIEEWRFPAHSFILVKYQTTLEELMKMAEPNVESATPSHIKLPNLDPDAFDQMLSFIYTGQVSLTSVKSALGLLEPSQKYHLPEVTALCLTYISKHLTPSEVLPVLSHLLRSPSSCHDNDNLQNELVLHCFQVVDRHADLVLQSEQFENLEHSVMLEIVKRDTLGVSSESVVFDAIMRWACRSCKKSGKQLTSENKSDVLGNALFMVRYLLMSPEEFLRGPMSQGVLSREDKELLLAKITSSNSHPLPEHWLGWKIGIKRQQPARLAALQAPTSSATSPNVEKVTCPERKKKSMSKKLLNGVGDLVICVIHMLD